MSYWKDSLLIGISKIDSQHRVLINAMDKLMDACIKEKWHTEVEKILIFTLAFAKAHFKDEENIYSQFAYPGIDAHSRLHAQFTERITDLVRGYETYGSDAEFLVKFNDTFVEELLDHIDVEDKKAGEYIQSVCRDLGQVTDVNPLKPNMVQPYLAERGIA